MYDMEITNTSCICVIDVLTNLFGTIVIGVASSATSCNVFPEISSKGINFFVCRDKFLIPTEDKFSRMSLILEPISAGSTTGVETCIIRLPTMLAFLKSKGFIDLRKPPPFV